MNSNKIQLAAPGELAMQFGLWDDRTGKLRFSNKVIAVDSIADASRRWCKMRDESGAGASESPIVMVVNTITAERIAKISYNGRAWATDGREIALCES